MNRCTWSTYELRKHIHMFCKMTCENAFTKEINSKRVGIYHKE